MRSYQTIQTRLQTAAVTTTNTTDPHEVKKQLIEYYGNLNPDSPYIQEVNGVVRKAEFHLKKTILEARLNSVFAEKMKVTHNEETPEEQIKRIIKAKKNSNLTITDAKEKTKKLAAILDFDDTLGSHAISIIEDDFANHTDIVDQRYRRNNIPPITPAYQLFKLALELDVEVFVVSYRKSIPSHPDKDLRPYVINNLIYNGIEVNEKNVYLPNEHETHLDSIVYKSNVREKITAAGYEIVLILGDQESDFPREQAHRKDKGHFLLPNKLYGKYSLLGTQTHVTGTAKTEEFIQNSVEETRQKCTK